MKPSNTVQGVNPARQVSEFAFFGDGRGIHNELDDRWTPTASTQRSLEGAKRVASHGPDQQPRVPLLVIQESTDCSRRLTADMIKTRQTQPSQKAGQHHSQRVLMLSALTCREHVSIKASSAVNLFRHNLNMREKDVLDKFFEN